MRYFRDSSQERGHRRSHCLSTREPVLQTLPLKEIRIYAFAEYVSVTSLSQIAWRPTIPHAALWERRAYCVSRLRAEYFKAETARRDTFLLCGIQSRLF